MKEKMIYEPPEIEVVIFEIEEAITQSVGSSGNSFFGTLGSEEIWGD